MANYKVFKKKVSDIEILFIFENTFEFSLEWLEEIEVPEKNIKFWICQMVQIE